MHKYHFIQGLAKKKDYGEYYWNTFVKTNYSHAESLLRLDTVSVSSIHRALKNPEKYIDKMRPRKSSESGCNTGSKEPNG